MLNQNARIGTALRHRGVALCLPLLLLLACDSLPGREKKHPPKTNGTPMGMDDDSSTGDGDGDSAGDGDAPGDGDGDSTPAGDGGAGDGDDSDGSVPTGDGDGEQDAGGDGDTGDGDGDVVGPTTVHIRAQDFRTGDGAYSDTTPTDEGTKGKPGEAVDIVDAGDPTEPGGLALGYTKLGEFVTYDFFIDATAPYKISMLVAHETGGGDVGIEIDGKSVATLTIPSTGGWTVWKTVESDVGTGEKGAHVLKVTMKTVGASGDTGNIRYFEFQPK